MKFFNEIPGVKLLEIPQGTSAWHDWRNGVDLKDGMPRITGTMAAIIAGCSVRQITPNQLWMELTGRKPAPEPSEYLKKLFAHGHRMEPIARARYINVSLNRVREVCVQHPLHPWAGASLDGLTASGDIITEIKNPISQRIHNLAKAGTVPDYYVPQCHWQMLCTPSAKETHYFSHFPEDEDGQRDAIVVVKRDPVYEQWLLNEALAFRSCLIENRAPVSDDWLIAAKGFRTAKLDAEEAEARVKAAQTTLLDLMPADRDTHEGGGVRVTRYAGTIEINYLEVLTSMGVSEEAVKDAFERSRDPGPVNITKAIELLSLDPAKVGAAEAVQKKEKEDALRRAGKFRSRFTMNDSFTPESTGRDVIEIAAERAKEAIPDADAVKQGQWTW